MKTFVIFFLVLAANICSAEERVQTPQYKDGDIWVYRVTRGNYSMSDSSRLPSGEYELRFPQKVFDRGAEVQDYNADFLLNLIHGDRVKWTYLRFPLFVGDKWRTSYTFAGSLGGKRTNSTRTVDTEVLAIETVSVPAGTFRTFKVVRTERGPANTLTYTCFYSPDVKAIVKYQYESAGVDSGNTSVELLSYKN